MAANIRKGAYRGTAKKGKEKKYDCTVCGDKKGNLEINQETGKFHCWRCGFSGRLPDHQRGIPSPCSPGGPRSQAQNSGGSPSSGVPLLEVPERGRLYIQHRGFNPDWVIKEYGVQWDGQRLVWPTGGGYARRAINDWDTPKVLVDGLSQTRGAIVGIERLKKSPGADLVITEGDFKAASIPLPWIGVGILGKTIHRKQAERLVECRPSTVTFFDDSNIWIASEQCVGTGLLARATTCITPAPANGPDDLNIEERTQLLYEAAMSRLL